MFKKERGITLIALIITIIILVILAAVSIRAVYNMGIVGHAINGSKDYAQKAVEENQMLDETGRVIENALEKLDKANKNMIKFYLRQNEGTSSSIELEVEEGTTWLAWANDRSKDTGNVQIDTIREYIRSLGADEKIDGDYKIVGGLCNVGLYDFVDDDNVNANSVIIENRTYGCWYEFFEDEYTLVFNRSMSGVISLRNITTDEDVPILESYGLTITDNYDGSNVQYTLNQDGTASFSLSSGRGGFASLTINGQLVEASLDVLS